MGFIEAAVPSVGLDSLSLLDLHYHSVQWTVTVLECRYSPFFFNLGSHSHLTPFAFLQRALGTILIGLLSLR